MKRHVRAIFAAAVVGMTGCEGGPTDEEPQPVPPEEEGIEADEPED